jgi:hypothetical protein
MDHPYTENRQRAHQSSRPCIFHTEREETESTLVIKVGSTKTNFLNKIVWMCTYLKMESSVGDKDQHVIYTLRQSRGRASEHLPRGEGLGLRHDGWGVKVGRRSGEEGEGVVQRGDELDRAHEAEARLGCYIAGRRG